MGAGGTWDGVDSPVVVVAGPSLVPRGCSDVAVGAAGVEEASEVAWPAWAPLPVIVTVVPTFICIGMAACWSNMGPE